MGHEEAVIVSEAGNPVNADAYWMRRLSLTPIWWHGLIKVRLIVMRFALNSV
jgi:hypothetical protein